MEVKRNGRTVVLAILVFGIVFTGLLIATMRNVGVESEDFNPPDMALPAARD